MKLPSVGSLSPWFAGGEGWGGGELLLRHAQRRIAPRSPVLQFIQRSRLNRIEHVVRRMRSRRRHNFGRARLVEITAVGHVQLLDIPTILPILAEQNWSARQSATQS